MQGAGQGVAALASPMPCALDRGASTHVTVLARRSVRDHGPLNVFLECTNPMQHRFRQK